MNITTRDKTKKVLVKDLQIGQSNHIVIQSMTNIKTEYKTKVLDQIKQLAIEGCELIRVSIIDNNDVSALGYLVKNSPIPIVADIHFDYTFAIKAMQAGVAKIRLNPGNLTDPDKLKLIVSTAKKYNTVIRVGVNCGSLPYDIQQEYGNEEIALLKAAQRYISLLEQQEFYDIVVSLKSSNPLTTIKAYQLAAEYIKYPLHLGVTESGEGYDGVIKSTIGLAPLLMNNIGNTIRISLTNDPIQEIYVAKKLLNTLNLRHDMVDIVSCPTCGRLEYDLFETVKLVKKLTANITKPIRISILGCVVNGIGEGKESDIGVAGNKNTCILFKKGQVYKTINKNELETELNKLIQEYLQNDK